MDAALHRLAFEVKRAELVDENKELKEYLEYVKAHFSEVARQAPQLANVGIRF